MRSWAITGAVASILALVVALSQAQSGSPGRVVLHEDIAPPDDDQHQKLRATQDNPVLGVEPGENQNPTAIASQDRLLAKPPVAERPNAEEPVHGRGGFGADRQTSSSPDRNTAADSTLHYTEVFNPSIVPFKRMSALNAIRSDYTLEIREGASTDLTVGGDPTRGRDLFWGSILVELSPGRDVPIPSVAAEMRILSYESTPQTRLTFSKDEADNYYLRSDEPTARGTFRVVFLVEADPGYFAPQPPGRYRVRDIPRDHVAEVPPNIRPVADRALAKLGLNRNMYADQALDSLVYYFRGFEAKEEPPAGDNIYWDLFESQAGVCRHRSFAFMITASALGIPTRFLSNEAHAWVEVWMPERGWMRVDLGGAASALNVANADDKAMYRPRGEDPFAKPDNYKENYTRLEGDIRGLRDDQIDDRQKPYEGTDGTGEGNGRFFDEDEPPEEGIGPLTGPGSDLPSIDSSEHANKEPLLLFVQEVSPSGYRGESASVKARALDSSNEGVSGIALNIFLAPAGNDGNGAVLVGRAVTDRGGRISTTVEIPTLLGVEPHEVYVAFDGNKTYAPALSE